MSNSLKMFLNGSMHVPFPIRGDAYTVAGECLSSDMARDGSIYNMTFRYSPREAWTEVAKDSRIVLYGLTDYIRNNLIQPITREDVNESAAFMAQARSGGLPYKFDRSVWDSIVEKHDGYPPIRIDSLPEGSTFFPNEPVIQVQSLYSGYGEVAAIIEAIMLGQVSTHSARVTLYRHWLERLIEWLNLPEHAEGSYQIAKWLIHDFGMRASSCGEESEGLGRAHLLVFNGTDTFNAAYQAWRMGAKSDSGKSILALAHRIVQGYKEEKDCYINLANQDTIGAYVADCYNFKRAVAELLIPLAKRYNKNIVVTRPDSGSMSENTKWVLGQLQTQGMIKDKKTENVRLIHGDSVTPRKSYEQIRIVQEFGVLPEEFMCFGVGGYGRNQSTRDVLSASYKLSAIRSDKYGKWVPVVKLSESITKLSVPGPSVIRRPLDKNGNPVLSKGGTVHMDRVDFSDDARQTFYNGGAETIEDRFTHYCYEDFSVVQDRVLHGFNSMGIYPNDYGTYDNTPWSDEIKNIQKEYFESYRN